MSLVVSELPGLLDSSYSMTINGKPAVSALTMPVYNPAKREAFAEVPVATRAQLDEAIDAGRAAFPGWSQTPIEARQAAVTALADRLEERAEEFMALLTREQGKPRAGAEWEIAGAIHWLREVAKQRLPEEVIQDTKLRRVITRYTPVGVVGAITPWNFPILLATWKIAPALMAGNTMVIKPSPFTPLTTLRLGELAQGVLPDGVLNVVSGDDDLGRWMTSHPGLDKISFTGSTETGRHVMRSAADNIKRITLELGGNDPAIVLPDVDPETVAPQLFWAAFQNNAQFCQATKRLYIHEDVYDSVRDALVSYARTVKVGDGAEDDTQIGPIQNLQQYEKVKEFFEDSRAEGHTFALGGQIDENAAGWIVPVTLVDNPPEGSKVVVEEPFGPILPLLKWKDEADVITRANDTIWGLGATIWSKDLEAAERIGSQIEAGTIWINEVHQYAPDQAFGGHKQSGLGCENSLHGLMEYTNWQTVTLNKVPDAV